MGAPIVFFDIAGPSTSDLSAFYGTVFGWGIAPDGSFSVSVVNPIPGTLRQDPAEKVVYVGVPDVTATLNLIVENGGAVVAPRFEVRGVVILGLFTDPAGNRLGLVEMDGERAKIP